MDKKTLYNLFSGKATETDKKSISDWLDQASENQDEMIRERKLFDMLLFAEEKKSVRTNRINLFLNKKWIRETLKIAAIVLLVAGAGVFFLKEQQNKLQ